MKKLTVLLYTYNSDEYVAECLASLKHLDAEVVAIDFESTDKTVQLLRNSGVKVYPHPFIPYVEPARDFGMDKVKTEWVFILDADERMTPELVHELNILVQSSPAYTHYKAPRKEIFAKKKWLLYGGWWPNHLIRLIHITSFKTWPKAIHSTPQIEGTIGYLEHPLLHYSQNDWSEIVEKTIRFEGAESDLLFAAGRSVNMLTFFRKFFGELYRRLIKGAGFRDGTIGIIETIYQAFSKTITYILLYEKKKKSNAL